MDMEMESRDEIIMKTGIKNRMGITVTSDRTAKEMGSGELPVLATPAMIALIEETCWRSVADGLEPGQGTVGTRLDVAHVSATPVGMKVWCESELIQIESRKLVFEVKVFDEAGLAGEGTHERFIINNDRFMSRTQGKAVESKSKEVKDR